MQLPINILVDLSIRELSKEEEAKVRKFIARYLLLTRFINVSKENLQKTHIFRKFFLSEIEGRYLRGDMQFLTSKVYGYIRQLIKYNAAEYMRDYIYAKKQMLL